MMDVARLNKQKSQLWWTVTILMIMCMYWLSNVVLCPVNGGRNYNGPKVAKFLVG